MNHFLKKVALGAVGIAVVFGFKMYGKTSAHDDYLKQTLEVCGNDEDCREQISVSFERCYDYAYDLGTRSRPGHLKSKKFVDCINRSAGKNLLAVSEESEN